MQSLYLDKIVLSHKDYKAWSSGGAYLSFTDGVVSFQEACEYCGIELEEHYDNEDAYREALADAEWELYVNGYYTCDDEYGFEMDSLVEWEFVPVANNWVIIRAYYSN